MLRLNGIAFLVNSDSCARRILIEGTVQQIDGQHCVIRFDPQQTLKAGPDVTLYAEVNGRVFQQSAIVTGESLSDGKVQISFQTHGEPIPGDRRGAFRTCTAMFNHAVMIDRVTAVLTDVSSEGLGVISPKPLIAGSTVDVALCVNGLEITERMKVRGSKVLRNGKLRFGLAVPSKNNAARTLLQKIACHFQHLQLRTLTQVA